MRTVNLGKEVITALVFEITVVLTYIQVKEIKVGGEEIHMLLSLCLYYLNFKIGK